MRKLGFLLVASLLAAVPVRAQEPGTGAAPAPSGGSGLPLFRFHLGRLSITPNLRISAITFDTNVFYDGTSRRSDVYAAGGPGLALELPVSAFVFRLDGVADYTHYFRTEELRRLGGGGGGEIQFGRGSFQAAVGRRYQAQYARPNYEVDQRVWLDHWENTVRLDFGKGLTAGKFAVSTDLSADRVEYEPGRTYLGTDPSVGLNRDIYRAGVEFRYRLTGKTVLVAGVDHQLDRFIEDDSRDMDSNLLSAGLEVGSATRMFGNLRGGVRLLRPQVLGDNFTRPFFDVSLGYHFGPRTTVTASYRFVSEISAFNVVSGYPSQDTESVALLLKRQFSSRIDLQMSGTASRYRTRAAVEAPTELGPPVRRRDTVYSAFADLGYTLLRRLRLGGRATYTERQATYRDFGVEGLLFGLTITFNPL